MIWLGGWNGDNAGPIVGRQNNRLLVAYTNTVGSSPVNLSEHEAFGNYSWYFNLEVACLTPGSRDAIAIGWDTQADPWVYSIEVAEVDFGLGKAAWGAGVTLFSVRFISTDYDNATAIATAIIDNNVPRIDMSQGAQQYLNVTPRPLARLRARHSIAAKGRKT